MVNIPSNFGAHCMVFCPWAHMTPPVWGLLWLEQKQLLQVHGGRKHSAWREAEVCIPACTPML